MESNRKNDDSGRNVKQIENYSHTLTWEVMNNDTKNKHIGNQSNKNINN